MSPLFISACSSLIWIPLQTGGNSGMKSTPPHREIFQKEPLFRMCFYTRLLRHQGHAFDIEAAPDRGSAALPPQIWGNARGAWRRGEAVIGLRTASVEMKGHLPVFVWTCWWCRHGPILSPCSKQVCCTCVVSVWHLRISCRRQFHQTHDC